MNLTHHVTTLQRLANAVGLAGILTLLSLALFFQFWLNELPCPLCFLQRIGFMGIALGFFMNLRFGFYPSHYAIVIFNAILICAFALRQIAKHVLPDTGAYGSAILGFHFYTWAFIFAATVLIGTTLLLCIDIQYTQDVKPSSKKWQPFLRGAFVVACIILALNIYTVGIECGLNECPQYSQLFFLR